MKAGLLVNTWYKQGCNSVPKEKLAELQISRYYLWYYNILSVELYKYWLHERVIWEIVTPRKPMSLSCSQYSYNIVCAITIYCNSILSVLLQYIVCGFTIYCLWYNRSQYTVCGIAKYTVCAITIYCLGPLSVV